jgi:hypothetical protein
MSEQSEQKRPRRLSAATRGVLAGAAMLLPSLTLIPLGGLYLWEHGLLLWWALFAFVSVLLLTGALKWLLRSPPRPMAAAASPTTTSETSAEAHWSAEESLAWADVLQIAAKVDPEKITSLDAFVALGQQTLNTVARRLHPEKTDALWQFTMPEALAIVERVSRRLGGFVVESVPFGDRLTVAQILAAYRWRGMFDVAERAYDIWRIVRLVNPATAVTNEARERLTRAVYNYGKEHVSRRIAEAFVEEVGRAAIDLYGGRLMVAQRLSSPQAGNDPLRELSARPLALNIAVGGGSRSDRLAVASLFSDVARARKLTATTAPASVTTTLSEPFATRSGPEELDELIEELQDADIIIWIVPDDAPDRDLRALAALAAHVRARGDAAIAVLVPIALSASASAADERRRHVMAVATGLAKAFDTIATPLIQISALDIVHADKLAPVVDAVQARLVSARRVHIQRVVCAARRPSGWKRSARQALKAATALTRAVVVRRGQD